MTYRKISDEGNGVWRKNPTVTCFFLRLDLGLCEGSSDDLEAELYEYDRDVRLFELLRQRNGAAVLVEGDRALADRSAFKSS